MIRIVGDIVKLKIKNMLLNEISVIDCQEDDYRFVHDLSRGNMEDYVKEHWGGWSTKAFKDSFNKNNIRIAKYGKRKIGFYDIIIKDGLLYLQSIQVIADLRGRGVGSFLMEKVEEEAKYKKIKKIRLKTFKNNPAKHFFSKEGYKVVDEDKSSLIMEKKI